MRAIRWPATHVSKVCGSSISVPIFRASLAMASRRSFPSLLYFLLTRMRFHCCASNMDGPADPEVRLAALAALRTSCSSMDRKKAVFTGCKGPWMRVFGFMFSAAGWSACSFSTTSSLGARTELSACSSRYFMAAPTFPSNMSLEKILETSSDERFGLELIFFWIIRHSFHISDNFPSFHRSRRCCRAFI